MVELQLYLYMNKLDKWTDGWRKKKANKTIRIENNYLGYMADGEIKKTHTH